VSGFGRTYNCHGVEPDTPDDVTALLRAWHGGDEDAYRQVSSMLYGELRRHATQAMRRTRSGEVLQTTALVHEAFMRLATAHNVDWQNRHHFLSVAARTMRRVLVDLARAQQSTKRGARAVHVELESGMAIADAPVAVDIVALDRALDGLAKVDKRKVQVIELRFFGGLTVEETADILQVSPDTVARDWRTARVWLLRELSGGSAA